MTGRQPSNWIDSSQYPRHASNSSTRISDQFFFPPAGEKFPWSRERELARAERKKRTKAYEGEKDEGKMREKEKEMRKHQSCVRARTEKKISRSAAYWSFLTCDFVAGLHAVPYISFSVATPGIPCSGSFEGYRSCRRFGKNARAPSADDGKSGITCASVPIRLWSWNNRLQRALRPQCSQMELLLVLRDRTREKKVSIRYVKFFDISCPSLTRGFLYLQCRWDSNISWNTSI